MLSFTSLKQEFFLLFFIWLPRTSIVRTWSDFFVGAPSLEFWSHLCAQSVYTTRKNCTDACRKTMFSYDFFSKLNFNDSTIIYKFHPRFPNFWMTLPLQTDSKDFKLYSCISCVPQKRVKYPGFFITRFSHQKLRRIYLQPQF